MVHVTTVDGWITPRLEAILTRAAELSTRDGYNYLGVEHVVLAMIEDGESVPVKAWQGSLTLHDWRVAVEEAMPKLPDPGEIREPVTVSVSRGEDVAGEG